MLILTRKTNETIYIGDDVKITVLGVNNGIARIGIEAPRGIHIIREELLTDEQRRKLELPA